MIRTLIVSAVLTMSSFASASVSLTFDCKVAPNTSAPEINGSTVMSARTEISNGNQTLIVNRAPTDGREVVLVDTYHVTSAVLENGSFELTGLKQVATTGMAPRAQLILSSFDASGREVEPSDATLILTPGSNRVMERVGVPTAMKCTVGLGK